MNFEACGQDYGAKSGSLAPCLAKAVPATDLTDCWTDKWSTRGTVRWCASTMQPSSTEPTPRLRPSTRFLSPVSVAPLPGIAELSSLCRWL